MDILERIDHILSEMDGGDMGGTTGTTTSKVAKIPMGTKKSFKYKEDEEEDEEELERKKDKDTETLGEL